MLEMKTGCETCGKALGPGTEAYICSCECTFCPKCNETVHRKKCPNWGGELVHRPKRKDT